MSEHMSGALAHKARDALDRSHIAHVVMGVPMKAIARKPINAFVAACREADARGLLRCSSGNLSCRADNGRMLVTRTSSWLGRLTADDIAVCAIEDGKTLNGVKPTVEVRFHAGILRVRPDVNVVLHYQSPFATALACRRLTKPNFNVIPEIPFYIGPVGQVPYLQPGSPELADAVIHAMTGHDVALMANHGQITVARDFEHAIQNAEFFELACQILFNNGRSVKPLPVKAVRALMAARALSGVPGA